MNTRELLLSAWSWNPLVVAIAVVALAAYGIRFRAALHRRAWFFVAGVLLFLLTLVSPVAVLADGYLFSAHMLQHLLLLLVIPALILLGLPGKDRKRPPQNKGAAWLARMLTFPAVTWLAGVGAMWLWHAPTLCDAAGSSSSVRAIQTVTLLAMGGLFWWPILNTQPARRLPPIGGAAYLFTACLGCTLLGIIITFSPVAVCSVYVHPADRLGILPLIRNGWGLTPALDQQVGGLMMWVPACLIYLSGILALLGKWYSDPQTQRTEPSAAGAGTARGKSGDSSYGGEFQKS